MAAEITLCTRARLQPCRTALGLMRALEAGSETPLADPYNARGSLGGWLAGHPLSQKPSARGLGGLHRRGKMAFNLALEKRGQIRRILVPEPHWPLLRGIASRASRRLHPVSASAQWRRCWRSAPRLRIRQRTAPSWSLCENHAGSPHPARAWRRPRVQSPPGPRHRPAADSSCCSEVHGSWRPGTRLCPSANAGCRFLVCFCIPWARRLRSPLSQASSISACLEKQGQPPCPPSLPVACGAHPDRAPRRLRGESASVAAAKPEPVALMPGPAFRAASPLAWPAGGVTLFSPDAPHQGPRPGYIARLWR